MTDVNRPTTSGPGGPGPDEDPAGHGPTVRDKRRIDPTTGAVRPGAPPSAPRTHDQESASGRADEQASDEVAAQMQALKAELDERTGDLQRVQAEYSNYRRRVDRDRNTAGEIAVGNVLLELFPVLDDIGRAREHGELVGGFKSVAERLEATLAKLGLATFGAVGDPFDPNRHDALMHTYSDEVTSTTCTEVFQPGYQLGERILRPARVAVADPTEALPATDGGATAGSAEGRAVDDGADGEAFDETRDEPDPR